MFKNKSELIAWVENQVNVKLENDISNRLNQKRNILYTQIGGMARYSVPRLLTQKGIRYESHINDYYWIWVR